MLKKELGLLVLILVICAITTVLNPQFISQVNLMNLANQIGLFGLLAIGLGLVIITGGIELSVGSMLALLGILFLKLLVELEVDWPIALIVTLLAGTLIGIVHGVLITRLKLQAFVVTLCGLLIYRGVARWWTADSTEGFGYGGGFETLEWLASGRFMGVPHTFIFFVVVCCLMAIVLHRSVFGRYLFAVGKNEEAARYSGLPTNLVIVAAYAICGLLTAISSILFVFYTQSVSPSAHGNFYELYAIAAAVLGGCSLRGGEGSILGIALGMILLQVLQNLVNMLGIPSSLNFAVMGAVILIGVIADRELQRRRRHRLVRAAPAGAPPETARAGAAPGKTEPHAVPSSRA
ncbi:MAG: ABC transporter permease [Reyranella sp.]|mgnify:FL=1|jgi:ribose transport system permease protein|uniref:ABC transporter permease n=1 Tax=Reyranella sp. TaxID=1929291 RepID=UPI0009591029|nr:ABC transporter permease [Reyranella sp.]MBN9535645.1 ABC transporter permease [Alphaproteobacteria bacterium]MBR2814458.1 ABC transporter permease [Reyranella sp.]OJU44277.1 MAG: sugar ABC transporter permease [Alphaproteobacteria bacterium 65-37]